VAAPNAERQPDKPVVASSNTTRDRILQASLALFNAQGLAAVSTHKIAAELGISPGNLHYHFKAKQLIVEWLFRRFEQRLEALNGSSASIAAIDDLWLALHLRFEAIDEYRFIYRDMAFLASEYPALGQRAQAMTAQNLLAAQTLCEGLVASGVIETSAEQARILALQMVFTTTCWLSFERLVPGATRWRRPTPVWRLSTRSRWFLRMFPTNRGLTLIT